MNGKKGGLSAQTKDFGWIDGKSDFVLSLVLACLAATFFIYFYAAK